jgi:hypothetical protein
LGPETGSQRAPSEIEHCHGGESKRWVKVEAFSYAQFHVIASIFQHNKLIECLALWDDFKVNSTLDIEESVENFHL